MLIDPCHELDEMPAGVRSMTVHVKPVAFRNAGALTRIEPAFANSGLVERPHIVTLAPFNVSVGDGGTRRIHPTRELDVWFEIGRPYRVDTRQPFPMNALIRSENKLTSTNTNYILSLVHRGHFVKLEIELLNGMTPPNNQFAFPIALNGLTYLSGTLLQAGVPVMNLVKPIVYDANNLDAPTREITHEIVTLAGQPYVVFTLPSLVGITRPVIDPTFTSQPDATAGKDNLILSNFDFNLDGDVLAIGERDDATSVQRTLIQFDLSSIPDGSTVSSATLSLYATIDRSSNARTFRVYRLKRAWHEVQSKWSEYASGSAWQTAGGFGADDCEQTDVGSRAFTATETLNEFKDFALTPSAVQDMLSGGSWTNNGWLLKADTETDDNYVFASSDDATAENRPKLVIVYTEASSGNPWHAYAQQ